YDSEASVRDAAFSALVRIYEDQPLLVAESGLSAPHEDVRRRALQVLIGAIRKGGKQDPGAAEALLVRALNDGAGSVRSEAFKAALNLKWAGGGADTLRFTLRSIHPDIRREALTEVMAQANEEWAWPLLLEFFNDPDPRLRDEGFAFAIKKNK